MADDTLLHDTLSQINGSLKELVAGQATNAAKLEALNERLFNGGSGAIPSLWGKFGAIGSDQAQLRKELVETNSKLTSVVTDRRVDKAWVVGFAAALTLVIKAGLSKLGLHF